jgi:hypothetical protein
LFQAHAGYLAKILIMAGRRPQSKIFASRMLLLDGTQKVFLRIRQPVKSGSNYACDFEIRGLLGLKDETAWGVDSMQALLLAIQGLRVRIKAYEGRLSLDGSSDSGLPSAMIFRNEMTERLCDIVGIAEKRHEARVTMFVADKMAERLNPDIADELNEIETDVPGVI